LQIGRHLCCLDFPNDEASNSCNQSKAANTCGYSYYSCRTECAKGGGCVADVEPVVELVVQVGMSWSPQLSKYTSYPVRASTTTLQRSRHMQSRSANKLLSCGQLPMKFDKHMILCLPCWVARHTSQTQHRDIGKSSCWISTKIKV
jgi:hypothetical protein